MRSIDSPYVLTLLAAAAISVAIAFFAWRRRSSPEAIPLLFLCLSAAIWQFGYGMELAASSQSIKVWWAKIEYLGIVTVAAAWLAVTLQYTGRGHWLTRRNMALVSSVLLVTLVLAWTNEAHGLIWSEIKPEIRGSLVLLEYSHGAWFYVFGAYQYLLVLAGFIFLADALLHSPRLYGRQGFALLISALVPWATNWSFSIGLTPGLPLDLTPYAFIVSATVLGWAVLRVRLLDLGPAARKAIVENMRDGVLVLDTLNRVVDCNAAVPSIVGWAHAPPIGSPVAEIWPDGPGFLLNSSEPVAKYQEITTGQGEARSTYDLTISPLYDGHSRPIGRLVLFHDITERKHEEERLREAARLASIGELAAGVAHEINNPLTAILGYSELLMQEDLPEPVKSRIQRINLQAQRSARIVNNLLAFARREEPEERYINVATVLEQSLELKDHDFRVNNIQVAREWAEDLPRTMADEHQLTQVLVNVLTNAQQAIHQAQIGGKITVRASGSGDKILITVADDGPGIMPEHLPHIFDPFFTTKAAGEGTGLGLSTCYGIVRQHEGRIWAESIPGEGATFHFELPIIAPPAAISPKEAELDQVSVSKTRCLGHDPQE